MSLSSTLCSSLPSPSPLDDDDDDDEDEEPDDSDDEVDDEDDELELDDTEEICAVRGFRLADLDEMDGSEPRRE